MSEEVLPEGANSELLGQLMGQIGPLKTKYMDPTKDYGTVGEPVYQFIVGESLTSGTDLRILRWLLIQHINVVGWEVCLSKKASLILTRAERTACLRHLQWAKACTSSMAGKSWTKL